MRNHSSLVLFTLLVQSAVGSVWCMQVALFWGGGMIGLRPLKYQILFALFLVLAGVSCAMTHLGKPGGSLHAIKNFKSSWLSREILSVNVFAGFLAVLAVLAYVRPGALNEWVLLTGSLSGGAALYAMTQVYRLRTVPSWNHAGTPLNFLGSVLLLGGLLFTLVLEIPTLLQVVGQEVLGRYEYLNIAFIAALMGFSLKLLAAGVSPPGATPSRPFKALQPVMQGCGLGLWLVYILSGGSPVFQTLVLSLAAFSLITGEVIHRIQFYDSYQRVGL